MKVKWISNDFLFASWMDKAQNIIVYPLGQASKGFTMKQVRSITKAKCTDFIFLEGVHLWFVFEQLLGDSIIEVELSSHEP